MKVVIWGGIMGVILTSHLGASMLDCQKDPASSESPQPTPYENKKRKTCSCPSW